MGWTEKDIRNMQAGKKIRGFKISGGANISSGNKITKKQKISAEKAWMELNLQYWCNERSFSLLSEHVFDEPRQEFGQTIARRKFRFDFCIPAVMVAIEYEGIFCAKSGHTTPTGFTSNAVKYNRAQQLGWKVLRFTAINYKDVIKELNLCI